jgi:hypothetical protein
MKRLLFLTLIYFFLPVESFGQTTFERFFGGSESDGGNFVQQTSDGGFVITGSTSSFGAGGVDIYLIKTNSSGDTLWTRTYGGSGYDTGRCVRQTFPDSGYIIVGSTDSYGTGGLDIYLIKIDTDGDTLWTKTYGGIHEDAGYSVQQTTDGGYIIAGYVAFWTLEDPGIYLIKTDSHGDTLWTKRYGGSQAEYSGEVVQTLPDSGYIVVGQTGSFGAGEWDVYLIKTNSLGDTLWTKTFGGSESDHGESVQQTSDRGFIITGKTESFGQGWGDLYLIKTSSFGDTLWTRTFGGGDEDYGEYVQETMEGDYIVTGGTQSFGEGWFNLYLIKIDVYGNTIWESTLGPGTYNSGSCVQQTTDGGYIVVGRSDYISEPMDVYLVKTDPDGSVGVSFNNFPDHEIVKSAFLFQNYPNPFNPSTTIQYDIPVGSGTIPVRVFVYNVRGHLVRKLVEQEKLPGTYQVHWDGRDEHGQQVSSGVYLNRVEAGDFISTRKMVLVR